MDELLGQAVEIFVRTVCGADDSREELADEVFNIEKILRTAQSAKEFEMTQADFGTTEHLFRLLDKWRHFAAYQLEPRTDVFFGMFLPMVVEERLGIEIEPTLIPQFPLKKPSNNQCDRVDYFAVARRENLGLLIEIKTDMGSQRESQKEYLKRAVKKGMCNVIRDLKKVAEVRNNKQNRKKYYHLLHSLCQMKVITLPKKLEDVMYSENSKGVFDHINGIRLTLMA